MVNELQPLSLDFDAADLPPVPPIQGTLFLSLLGVDSGQLLNNIIILNCLAIASVASALAAMTARIALVRRGWVA